METILSSHPHPPKKIRKPSNKKTQAISCVKKIEITLPEGVTEITIEDCQLMGL
jgi:hypothetical protein